MSVNIENIRLACYFVPPIRIYSYLDSLRQYVCAEIGSTASLRFPIHITIQGFFKPKIDTEQALYHGIIASIRETVIEAKCFNLYLETIQVYGDEVLFVSVGTTDDSDNLVTLIKRVRHSLTPFILVDGTNEKDIGYSLLPPHFTLAFKDIPQNKTDKLRSLKSEIKLKRMVFPVSELQLFEFESADWYDAWWNSHKWRNIGTFCLKHKRAQQ